MKSTIAEVQRLAQAEDALRALAGRRFVLRGLDGTRMASQ
jgi:hypothetical protein